MNLRLEKSELDQFVDDYFIHGEEGKKTTRWNNSRILRGPEPENWPHGGGTVSEHVHGALEIADKVLPIEQRIRELRQHYRQLDDMAIEKTRNIIKLHDGGEPGLIEKEAGTKTNEDENEERFNFFKRLSKAPPSVIKKTSELIYDIFPVNGQRSPEGRLAKTIDLIEALNSGLSFYEKELDSSFQYAAEGKFCHRPDAMVWDVNQRALLLVIESAQEFESVNYYLKENSPQLIKIIEEYLLDDGLNRQFLADFQVIQPSRKIVDPEMIARRGYLAKGYLEGLEDYDPLTEVEKKVLPVKKQPVIYLEEGQWCSIESA